MRRREAMTRTRPNNKAAEQPRTRRRRARAVRTPHARLCHASRRMQTRAPLVAGKQRGGRSQLAARALVRSGVKRSTNVTTHRDTTTPHAPCSAAAVRTTEVISRAAAAGAAERRLRLSLGYMLNYAARLRRSAASSQLASRTRRSSHSQQRIGGGAGRLRCGALTLPWRNTRT